MGITMKHYLSVKDRHLTTREARPCEGRARLLPAIYGLHDEPREFEQGGASLPAIYGPRDEPRGVDEGRRLPSGHIGPGCQKSCREERIATAAPCVAPARTASRLVSRSPSATVNGPDAPRAALSRRPPRPRHGERARATVPARGGPAAHDAAPRHRGARARGRHARLPFEVSVGGLTGNAGVAAAFLF
jgi:hypothetical protein